MTSKITSPKEAVAKSKTLKKESSPFAKAPTKTASQLSKQKTNSSVKGKSPSPAKSKTSVTSKNESSVVTKTEEEKENTGDAK